MNSLIIRDTTEEDLEGIASLFLPQKRDVSTLKWVLQREDGSFRSFVAENNKKIVGHLAYIDNTYCYGGKTYTGAFSIEWIVDPQFSQAGLKLYSRVLKIGDFTYIIGGTDVVNKMYPLMKFHIPFQVSRCIKVTKPLQYFQALDNQLWKKLAKTLYHSRTEIVFLANRLNTKEIDLIPYSSEKNHLLEPIPKNIVLNTASKTHLQWIARAPAIECHDLIVRKNKHPFGRAICYVQKSNGITCGRIVHLSFLGEDPVVWRKVIIILERFLIKKGCCIISILASYDPMLEALKKQGYETTHQLPFWLRDRKKYFTDAPWHFSYIEGDLAYRGIFPGDFRQVHN